MTVRISSSLLHRFVSEARTAGRREICGLLLGDEGRIEDGIAIPNAASDAGTRFEFDPAAHVAASRTARLRGLSILGFYHSHPSGLASPSAADAAGAAEEGRLWLIVAPSEQRLWVSRAGGAVLGAFEPVEMILD